MWFVTTLEGLSLAPGTAHPTRALPSHPHEAQHPLGWRGSAPRLPPAALFSPVALSQLL